MEQLKPCPFCGWDADGPHDTWEEGYTIICCSNQSCACEIKLPQPSVFTVAAWNRRTKNKPLPPDYFISDLKNLTDGAE